MSTLERVEVNPLVVFNFLDTCTRLGAGREDHSIFGVLLGLASGTFVHITNLVFLEEAQLSPDLVEDEYRPYQMANEREVIVGWFNERKGDAFPAALNDRLRQVTEVFHDRPVHIVFDPALEWKPKPMKASIVESLKVQDSVLAVREVSVPIFYSSSKAERTVIEQLVMMESKKGIQKDYEAILKPIRELEIVLRRVDDYVKSVLDGTAEPDEEKLRNTYEALEEGQFVLDGSFDRIYGKFIHDMLNLVFLSSAVQAHVPIAEKITSFHK